MIMELIEYREAEFDVIRTISCERTRMKDEANNYLYTHWDFVVEVNYQPAMISYSRALAFPHPQPIPGMLPGETDLALLNYLLQPRGLLKVTAGDSVILETPEILEGSGTLRMPCDVRGGPSVEAIGVPVMIGTRHWVVTLHFIADVRDQIPVISGYQNAIISNLWVGTEDIDIQRRSVRRFAGSAILRADVMRAGNVNANSFRDLFLFRCPDHYQRQNVHAQLSHDGTVCEWSFEDVMRGYNLGATSPIVDIECYRTGHVRCGSPAKFVVDTARHLANNAVMAAGFDVVSAGTSLVAAAASAATLALMDNLPKSYVQCRCDIVGDRNAHLGRLTSIALGVCMQQVGLNIGALLTGTVELTFRQDLADRVYTSVELVMSWTDDALFLGAAAHAVAGNTSLALAALRSGAIQLVNDFQQDSRRLNIAGSLGANTGLPNESVAAARDGSYNSNPPMTQGAFGVRPNMPVPQNTAGFVPSAVPTGFIPAEIEKFIVQALIGEDQIPPQPPTLINQS